MARRIWTRRSFLRGVGVSMALPWMESLPALHADERPETGTGAEAKSPDSPP